ncbi:hypothetical protein M8J76_006279 [Diaphorina citri]|nr:hypothetical protein M8J76_006279 [Diaphorina citri]
MDNKNFSMDSELGDKATIPVMNNNNNVKPMEDKPKDMKINMDETGNLSRMSSVQESRTYNFGNNDFILVEGPVLRGRKISVREKINSVGPWIEDRLHRGCSRKQLTKRLPITRWLPQYSLEDGIGDLVAGITVGLTVILQAIAYSNIAGLEPQYGLYGSFVGAIIYIFVGTCKDVPMGPTAMVSLVTYQAVKGYGPQFANLLTLLSGIIQLMMGVFGLGIMLDFISGPVASGFTSAVAIIITSSQIKDILGISGGGATFVKMWVNIISNIENTSYPDLLVGVICIAVSLMLREIAKIRVGHKNEDDSLSEPDLTWTQNTINKIFWLIGTSRNCVIVIASGLVGYYMSQDGPPPYKIVGKLPPGLPSVGFPLLTVQRGNTTYDFFDMVSIMGSGIFVTPLIAVVENIAVCKAFAHGKSVDATQEILAVGVCNLASCFFQAYPVSGSISRSAVQSVSGVRTPMVGIYTAIIAICSLLWLTPYFFYIPKASLAAVIISAVIFMVEVRVVKPIYRSKKSDLIPGLVTFIACLILPLEIGFVVGVGLNLMFILYHAARPKISMEIHTSRVGIEYLLLTPDRCLIFPSVDYVSNLVTKHSIKQGIPVVVDCSHIYGADFTAAKVIEVLCQNFSRRGQPLFFFNLKPSVVAVFEGVQPKDFVVYYDSRELDHLLRSKITNGYSCKINKEDKNSKL